MTVRVESGGERHHGRSSTARRYATRSTGRPPTRWPRRSARSTPTRRARSPCSGARAARSAPAPTSRRRRRRAATGSRPTATARWAPRGMLLSQAGDRRDRRPRGRRRARAGAAGATCGWSRQDAVLGVFCRRWGVPLIDGGTVAAAAADRPVPRARPHPHRAPGRRRRGAGDGPRQPRGAAAGRARGGRGAGARDRRVSPGVHARATAAPPTRRPTSPWKRRCGRSSNAARRCCRGRAWPEQGASREAPAGTAPSRNPASYHRSGHSRCHRTAIHAIALRAGGC